MPKPMSFSQRAGFVSPRTAIQVNSLDDTTRTALWNCFYKHFISDFISTSNRGFNSTHEFGKTYTALWTDYLYRPLDTMSHDVYDARDELHKYFFSRVWHQVFDLLEFVLATYSFPTEVEKFAQSINCILEQELSGYRLVNKLFTRITSEEEIQAIELALSSTDMLKPVQIHISDALSKLSDRQNPDFRNSIKEAISAVEALSKIIAKKPKATLGDALSTIEKQGKIKIHSALKNAFSSIYGWTNDAQGIRHALLDEPTLTFGDAKFMLVSCSAFISYLLAKCSDAGIYI